VPRGLAAAAPAGAGRTSDNGKEFLRLVFESARIIKPEMSGPLAILLRPVAWGWAVCLTNGRELARFRGPGAHRRALRWLVASGLAPHPASI
jgi:hypothetical protein